MPVDRPTFSESWYRVAGLRPRLRSTLQTHRQHYRAQMWHVIQDPSNNQFFRLNEAAYRFVGLLDGRRNVSEVWRVCNEQLGDGAPTQGEAIQLLGQLYTSNLLQGDLPPDAEGLFRRYNLRVTREVQGYLTNLLFIRVPLFDPDWFLDRFLGLFGAIFSVWGLVLWAALLATGFYFLADRWGELVEGASNVLNPESLPLLYVSFVLVKVFHEFGHAFACKKYGRASGSGGEVHVMGVMFLVFTPLPYVDASSAWALRSTRHRVVVGAAGMLVELGIAAVAAVVWSQTGAQTTAHAICYNVMFIASVSSILFNANPLLRYDGYYIFSDLLEIPNLAQRSKDYLYYLVKQYVWGVRNPRDPSHTRGEKGWLLFYAVASTVYRIVISVAILLFVADFLPVVGVLLAAVAVVAWVLVPVGKFLHYLVTSGELLRVRARAVATAVAVPAIVLAAVGLIPAPDRVYLKGVVEPADMKIVYTGGDGFVAEFVPSGTRVTPDGPPLVRSVNRILVALQDQYEAERRELVARRGIAMTKEQAAVQIVDEQIQAVDEKLRRVRTQRADLEVHAPVAGTWISPSVDRLKGAYLKRGQALGLVATMDALLVRAVANQNVAGPLMEEARDRVEIRMEGRPDKQVGGRLKQFLPAGQDQLPSPALGFLGGGTVATRRDDETGTRTAERIFEIHVVPDPSDEVRLLAGQRVVIRFETTPKPLMVQAWRSLLQMLQRRFQIT